MFVYYYYLHLLVICLICFSWLLFVCLVLFVVAFGLGFDCDLCIIVWVFGLWCWLLCLVIVC